MAPLLLEESVFYHGRAKAKSNASPSISVHLVLQDDDGEDIRNTAKLWPKSKVSLLWELTDGSTLQRQNIEKGFSYRCRSECQIMLINNKYIHAKRDFPAIIRVTVARNIICMKYITKLLDTQAF